MMKHTIQEIQQKIELLLPEGKVIARHNEKGHFYEVTDGMVPGPVYPSVTGKLQILKDEGLINYKMNRAIEYVFKHFKEMTNANLMDHLDTASRVSQDILEDAGDIGTQIHDTRERIFSEWIFNHCPQLPFTAYIDPANPDPRCVSAIRALEKFCIDYQYIPIATELFVYSHTLKVAGTLDDLGVMDKVVRPGSRDCKHDMVGSHCMHCDRKIKRVFVLMDLKSSNQLKDHYFFQVSLYWEMFRKIIGIAPEQCIILKLSKEDGTYKIEDLKRPAKLVEYAKAMLKTNDAVQFIRSLRKDNQKVVSEKIEL